MAQVDMFLKLSGVEGESTDEKHNKEIDITSFTWSEVNDFGSSRLGGSGKGKAVVHDFVVTMPTCKASPVLAKKCAQGVHFAEGRISCRKAGEGQKDYLVYHFKELFITRYEFLIDEIHVRPIDKVSFVAAYIEMDYRAQDEKGGLGGSIKFGYNQKTMSIT